MPSRFYQQDSGWLHRAAQPEYAQFPLLLVMMSTVAMGVLNCCTRRCLVGSICRCAHALWKQSTGRAEYLVRVYVAMCPGCTILFTIIMCATLEAEAEKNLFAWCCWQGTHIRVKHFGIPLYYSMWIRRVSCVWWWWRWCVFFFTWTMTWCTHGVGCGVARYLHILCRTWIKRDGACWEAGAMCLKWCARYHVWWVGLFEYG